jgi:hypothetical protein
MLINVSNSAMFVANRRFLCVIYCMSLKVLLITTYHNVGLRKTLESEFHRQSIVMYYYHLNHIQ